MNCTGFENRLERFRKGTLNPVERQGAEDHLRICPSCRELARVACSDIDPPPLPVPKDLTRTILERTSGPACGRVREHICDFVDGTLAASYAEILSLHLADCGECSALAESLSELRETLPQLGEIDPGMNFTYSVIRATSRRQPEPYVSLWLRIQQWWLRLIQRPRFSWEAAYLGTILLVCVLGNPLSTFDALSLRVSKAWKSERAVSFSSVALPGSILSSEAGLLTRTRNFADAFSIRQEDLARSAEGVFGRSVRSLQGSVQADLQSIRSLSSNAVPALKRAWATLFPKPAK